MESDSTRVALFKALGDPTRHLITQVLSHQELAVNELVEALNVPQSTVSRHLRVLREAGLVSDRREGVTVYCRVALPGADEDAIAGSIRLAFREQPLPKEIASRVDGVLRRRRERSSEFFDKRGEEWDDLRHECFGQQFPLEAVLGLLPGEWTAADLGTGTGYLLPALSRAFRRVIAVDHNRQMLARASGRIAAHGLDNVDLRCGELESLPIETGRLDLAIAMLVLHHVSEPGRALAEMARTLRPGGMLLLVELAEHDDEELQRAMGDVWMGFSPERLSAMTVEAGMSAQRVMALSSAGSERTPSGKEPSLFALIGRKTEPDQDRSLD